MRCNTPSTDSFIGIKISGLWYCTAFRKRVLLYESFTSTLKKQVPDLLSFVFCCFNRYLTLSNSEKKGLFDLLVQDVGSLKSSNCVWWGLCVVSTYSRMGRRKYLCEKACVREWTEPPPSLSNGPLSKRDPMRLRPYIHEGSAPSSHP